jgi:hypothetical protein
LTAYDSPRNHIILARPPGHRHAPPDQDNRPNPLKQPQVEYIPNLKQTPESLVVVAGSLRTAAIARETFGLLSDAALEEARTTRALLEGSAYLDKLRPTGQTGSAPPAR